MKAKPYIRGRRNVACVSLMKELSDAGIRASVGHESRGNVLFVYTMFSDDVEKVPRTFGGWDVVAKHFSEK
jgi:hypothetical protein